MSGLAVCALSFACSWSNAVSPVSSPLRAWGRKLRRFLSDAAPRSLSLPGLASSRIGEKAGQGTPLSRRITSSKLLQWQLLLQSGCFPCSGSLSPISSRLLAGLAFRHSVPVSAVATSLLAPLALLLQSSSHLFSSQGSEQTEDRSSGALLSSPAPVIHFPCGKHQVGRRWRWQ